MSKCDCCKQEKTELDLFKYRYGSKNFLLCNTCWLKVEEHFQEEYEKDTLKLTPKEIRKLQLRNEQINYRLKRLDFNLFPRGFLEDFISYFREKKFNDFKQLIFDYQNEKGIRIFNINSDDGKNKKLTEYIDAPLQKEK